MIVKCQWDFECDCFGPMNAMSDFVCLLILLHRGELFFFSCKTIEWFIVHSALRIWLIENEIERVLFIFSKKKNHDQIITVQLKLWSQQKRATIRSNYLILLRHVKLMCTECKSIMIELWLMIKIAF